MPLSELGDLLTRMTNALAVRTNRTKGATLEHLHKTLHVSTDLIYKWRKGSIRPSNDNLAQLVDIGVREAGMEYAWANAVLTASQHPRHGAILESMFSSAPVSSAPRGVRSNLPALEHSFVGRSEDLAKIMVRLEPQSSHRIIPIEGVAGIGKTALARKIAWDYVAKYAELPAGRRFEAVICTSAKRKVLTTRRIISRDPTMSSLEDVFRTIGEVLEDPALVSQPERHAAIQAIRVNGPVLLILDNLEVVSTDVLDFLWDFLADMPVPSKVLVPIRFHEDLPFPIRLGGLDDADMQRFIVDEAKARDLTLTLEQIHKIIAAAGGVPLAAWYAMGVMAMNGINPDSVDRSMLDEDGQLAHYIFDEELAQFQKEQPEATKVLTALSYFAPFAPDSSDAGATMKTLITITGYDQETCWKALRSLYRYNLVSERQSGDDSRFSLLKFTRQVAPQRIAKIAAGDHLTNPPAPDTRDIMRDTWLQWYREYFERLGTYPLAREESIFQEIGAEWANLQELFSWLRDQHRLSDLAWFWRQRTLLKFAEIQGHWSVAHDWLADIIHLARSKGKREVELVAQVSMGRFEVNSGDPDHAEEHLTEAWELCTRHPWTQQHTKQRKQREGLSAASYRCEVALNYFHYLVHASKPREATAVLAILGQDDMLPFPTELGNYERDNVLADLLCQQAKLAFIEGHRDQAQEHYQRLLDICDGSGWERVASYARYYLAEIALQRKDWDEARTLLEQALAVATRFKYHSRVALIAQAKGRLDRRQQDLPPASVASALEGAIGTIEAYLAKIDVIGADAGADADPVPAADRGDNATSTGDQKMNAMIRARLEERQAPVNESGGRVRRATWILDDGTPEEQSA